MLGTVHDVSLDGLVRELQESGEPERASGGHVKVRSLELLRVDGYAVTLHLLEGNPEDSFTSKGRVVRPECEPDDSLGV